MIQSQMTRLTWASLGGAEFFAGPENVGPQNSNSCKMQELIMTDQIAGLENAGPGK